MTSSNVLLFPGRTFDIVGTTKFYGHWPSYREVTRGGGGGERNPPPALPDSEKSGLFRVKRGQTRGIHVGIRSFTFSLQLISIECLHRDR